MEFKEFLKAAKETTLAEAVKSDIEVGFFDIPDTKKNFGIDPTDLIDFMGDFEVDEGETGEGSFFIAFDDAKERTQVIRALKNIGFKDAQIQGFIVDEDGN